MKTRSIVGIGLLAVFLPMSYSFAYHSDREEDRAKEPNIVASATTSIDAPIEEVWAVLAKDFAGIDKWASGVAHSQGFGLAIGDSPHSIRACEITAAGFDDTKEKILTINSEDHVLRYTLSEGLPGFVKSAENEWTLKEENGKTHVTARTEMYATGFLTLTMKGLMRSATRKTLENMCREAKYYVEKGEPHPNKVASQKKLARKDARKRKKVVSFTIDHYIDAPVTAVWKVIGEDFAQVSDSNPNSPKSAFLVGFTQAEEGARRIMYMSENEKKYFVDKIVEWKPDHHRITIEIVEKKGFPIVPGYTWLNMNASSVSPNKTKLQITFNYLTKPAFLRGLAKGGLKKNFQDYAHAIDHHVTTGEIVTAENWKESKKKYQ